ncbi:MAG TPA: hypothetical protein DCR20_07765 [Planctomycetaceae bacterium]|jgi:hypothetical protein|nr:hypothetical protein [Planctomycetaceae bacterium]
MASRREKLEVMLQAAPDDQLVRYMLAMETDREGATDRSLELFQDLMDAPVPYVPAFLMAGQLLMRLNRSADARHVFQAGIRQAELQQNTHAAGEMAGFLATLNLSAD